MNAVNRTRTALRIDLTLPVTRVGWGPFSIDPVEQLIGAPVAEILESLLVAPVHRGTSAAGPVDVYPLALPDGEGASIELGAWGELGVFNDGGLLVLTVPANASAWLSRQLGAAVLQVDEVRGPNGCRLARLWVRLRAGAAASLPISGIGEIGLRVAL